MKSISTFLLLMSFCLLLTGCRKQMISAQTEYITRQSRASYRIGTPDPVLNHPIIGQRLIIEWSIPESMQGYSNLHIDATLRFRNRTEQRISFPIRTLKGMQLYTIAGDDFCKTGGLLTYKIDIFGNDCLLKEWYHQLWVDLISLDQTDNNHFNKCLNLL